MATRSPRVVARADVLRGQWPDGVSVLISPGIGGGRRERGAFAQTANIVYAGLEEAGVTVAYAIEDQQPDCVLLLKSADWWGPVLTIGGPLLTGVAASAIYDVVKKAIGRTQAAYGTDVRAHLDIEEVREVGRGFEREVRTTHLAGDAKTVLDGLDRILRAEVDRGENQLDD